MWESKGLTKELIYKFPVQGQKYPRVPGIQPFPLYKISMLHEAHNAWMIE